MSRDVYNIINLFIHRPSIWFYQCFVVDARKPRDSGAKHFSEKSPYAYFVSLKR